MLGGIRAILRTPEHRWLGRVGDRWAAMEPGPDQLLFAECVVTAGLGVPCNLSDHRGEGGGDPPWALLAGPSSTSKPGELSAC